MARGTWKGSISFGLVNIPVTLHPAEDRDETLHFVMLDERDSSLVGYQRVNKSTGKVVPWENVVKGYEIDDGQYVLVTPEDFKKAYPKSTQTIEVLDFVDAGAIGEEYYETPYYLEPGKKGEKGYALLREALAQAGKVGIAKVVLRTKQYLAALIPRGEALTLELLRYDHELRDPAKLELPAKGAAKAGVSVKELAMARKLIDAMASKWEPKKYRDDFTRDMLSLIERKAKQGKVEAVEEPLEDTPMADVLDLMPLLKRSLQASGRGAASKAKPEGSRRSGAIALASARKAARGARKKTARKKSA